MNPSSRENRLRRAARSLGLRLEKSRVRDPHDLTFGGYMLTFIERNAIAYGAAGHKGRGYTLTLDAVEEYLERSEKLQKIGRKRRHELSPASTLARSYG